MKWKYQNEEEKEEETQQIVTINASPAGGGGVTKIVENNLYFYGDITESNALELNAALYEMDKKLSVTDLFLNVKPHINLHINSYGGSLFAGLATVDTIRNLNSEVHSYIEGAGASAASAAAAPSGALSFDQLASPIPIFLFSLVLGLYSPYYLIYYSSP